MPIPPNEQIIVQLPMGVAADDLELRNHAMAEPEGALAAEGLGVCDGVDIGSGTMNIFFYTHFDDVDRALVTMRSVLTDLDPRRRGADGPARHPERRPPGSRVSGGSARELTC